MADERELLHLIKNDDKSAIKLLFEKYHQVLCNTACRIIRDKDTAKDIVQEVFIKFWKGRKSIEITISLAAYLKRAVINTSLNHIEKEQRYPKMEVDALSDHLDGRASDDDQAIEELSHQIKKAINKLPPRTRAVFILIRQEELSYKEVSKSLGISLKAVEKEMMKALRLLREMLKDILMVLIALISSL